jgi:hypothetical protein
VDWTVTISDSAAQMLVTYHGDGTVEREPFGAYTELVTFTAPGIQPEASTPGDNGNPGKCVRYCEVREDTYEVKEVTVRRRVEAVMSYAACTAVGGAASMVNPAVGWAAGAICTYVVHEVTRRERLIGSRCLREDVACSGHPYRAPTIPRTRVIRVYIAG